MGRPAYRLPEDFPKRRVLFGWPQAFAAGTTDTALLVVESTWSVLHLFQHGYPAVATLGAHLSDEQAQLLLSLRRPIALLFDGDRAGQDGMRQAAGKLITSCWTRVVRIPEEAQPDHLNREQLLREYLPFLTPSVPSDR